MKILLDNMLLKFPQIFLYIEVGNNCFLILMLQDVMCLVERSW